MAIDLEARRVKRQRQTQTELDFARIKKQILDGYARQDVCTYLSIVGEPAVGSNGREPPEFVSAAQAWDLQSTASLRVLIGAYADRRGVARLLRTIASTVEGAADGPIARHFSECHLSEHHSRFVYGPLGLAAYEQLMPAQEVPKSDAT